MTQCAFCDITVLKVKLADKRTKAMLIRHITLLQSWQPLAHPAFLYGFRNGTLTSPHCLGSPCDVTDRGTPVCHLGRRARLASKTEQGLHTMPFLRPRSSFPQVHSSKPGNITTILAELLQQNQQVYKKAVAVVTKATDDFLGCIVAPSPIG